MDQITATDALYVLFSALADVALQAATDQSEGWLLVADDAAQDAALELARGKYQRNLLTGWEALSGSTLRGKAARYGGRYAESRSNLLARLDAAGIPWCSTRRRRGGARVLVIGAEMAI